MGRSYESARGLWWKGTSSILWNQIQDDIDVVNGVLGFRDDDHGNDTASATPLSIVSNTLSAAGIIENMPDRDWFSFTTDGGGAAFNVNPFSPGGMLDASLYLYNADGTLIASSATTNLSESLTLTLTAGTYDVVVGGAGRYGDIGQYTLEGTFGLVPEPASIASLFLLVAFARRRRVPESESRNGGAAL